MARSTSKSRSFTQIRTTLSQDFVAQVTPENAAKITRDMATKVFAAGYDGIVRRLVKDAGKSTRPYTKAQARLVLDVCAAHGATVAKARTFLAAKAARREA